MSHRQVVGPPLTQQFLTEGISKLTKVLRLTLGPNANRIAVAGTDGRQSPELLADAATLSQRVLQLADPFEDMGNQMLRRALADLSERTGDGAAGCSVLTDAMLRRAAPLLAAGHHPSAIVEGLRTALDWVITDLAQRVWPIDSLEEIGAVVRTATNNVRLASMISEILDTIGPDGSLVVEETRHVGMAHEYVHGARWNTGQASPSLMTENETQTAANSPYILVSATPLTSLDQVIPLLELVAGTSSRSLMLIAPAYSDKVIGLLVANRQQHTLSSIIAVKSPQSIHYGAQILADIAVMVGSRLITKEESYAWRSIKVTDLGQAQRAWASRSAFGIIGGAGDREMVGHRIRAIKSQAKSEADALKRSRLSERAGNLTGLSAIVRVEVPARGRRTSVTREVENTAAIARQAMLGGVVVGGGAALAHSANGLRDQFVGSRFELGSMVLSYALCEPMKVILENAGLNPGPIVNRAQTQSNAQAFDVLTGTWVMCSESGPIDSWPVVKASLEVAVSTAVMVLSTNVLVSKKR